jgi:hypothetical protein
METEGLSNLRVKTELGLGNERYEKVREELLDDGIIKKYAGRGGGIRLTRKGEKEKTETDETISSVQREQDLYEPFISFLERQAEEDEVDTVCCATHSLRARGRWQNPDVTQITIERYHYLRKFRVRVTTYELKQFPRWDVGAIYEAASHHRFSHQSIVVLEWPRGAHFSLTDPTYRLDQLSRECQRYGVGLATLEPWYSSHWLNIRIEPRPYRPTDEAVDLWLDYVLSRNAKASSQFESAMESVQKKLGVNNQL